MAGSPLTIMSLVSGDGRGGSDRLALDVSKGLKRRGHRVIWASPQDCCLNAEAASAGLAIYNLYPSGSVDLSALPDFIDFCKAGRVDIVNAHHSHSRYMLLRARLRGLRSKTVFTRHCILRTAPYVGAIFHNLLIDMHIAVSNVVRESLLRSGILSRKAVTVHGGVELEKFENIQDRGEEFSDRYTRKGAFTIGMIARLQHVRRFGPGKPTLKGHDVLFRAAAGLEGDFNILLLGPWEEKDFEKLKLIARHHGLDNRKITFCGFQEDIAPFYRIMDLNVLPSPREGLPLAVIEPMAAGVPCIGADGGGIREIIADGVDGFLIRPGDSRDLADKMRIIRDDAGIRESFMLKGREKVRRLFDIEKAVEETERVFCGLVS